MREVSGDLPKPMLPVAGRPFVEHLVAWLARSGVRRIVLSVGHRFESLQRHFRTGAAFGVRITYAVEREPLGTGGALRLACEDLDVWPVLALNGDSFVNLDLGALLAAHESHRAPLTVALVRVPDSGRYGRVRLRPDGAIAAFDEKAGGGAGAINAGVYAMERECLAAMPAGASSLERDVLPEMARRGAMGFTTSGFFVDIGLPEDYQRLADAPETFLQAISEVRA